MPSAVTVIPEDGSVVAGANSFVTEAEVNTYVARRSYGPDSWEPTDDHSVFVVESCALLVQEIRARGWRWRGGILSTAQVLPLPRFGLFDPNGVFVPSATIHPDAKNTQSEIALQLFLKDLREKAITPLVQSTHVNFASRTSAVSYRDPALIESVWLHPMLWMLDTSRRVVRG